jgi:hypothetical protein
VPVDTPTPGAKRPFNFRLPLGNFAPGSLPGNPFARVSNPFQSSGGGSAIRLPYPNQLPVAAIAPGPITGYLPSGFDSSQVTLTKVNISGIHLDGTGNPDAPFSGTVDLSGYRDGITVQIGTQSVPGHSTHKKGIVVKSNGVTITTWNPTVGFKTVILNSVAYFSTPTEPYNPISEQPIYAPNPSRPTTPAPLQAPDPNPAEPFTNPPQPAKQPLPYISPEPAPLAPGDGPLPDELTRPDRSTDEPLKQPLEKPSKQPLDKGTSPRPTFSPETAFAVGVALGQSLGATATAAINSTEAQAIKELLKTGIQLRTGEQRPATTPVNGITGGKEIDPLIDIIKEQIPNAPAEKINNCPPSQGSDCKYDNKDISGKCEKIQAILDENLDRNYSKTVDFLPCEDDEEGQTISLSADNKGIVGIDEKLNILAEAMNMIWERVKCDKTPLISIADAWEIKKELNTGQLVIVTKKPNDKTSYRRNFCIPHPRITTQAEAKGIFNTRRKYERGNHLVTLILKDNSKIRLNVNNENTGQELMDWLVTSCLDFSYQETPAGQYRHTGNAGREIIPCQVEIYSVAYYPTGKKGEMPDWQFIIPQ